MQKKCFVVSPIGSDGSDIRKRADRVLKYVIKPPLQAMNYEISRADEISDPGMISVQMIDRLIHDDLVIADLSGHNPNVFYELAIRHALGKPFIQIISEGEKIPFDVSDVRTIVFDHTDLESVDLAKKLISDQAKATEDENFKVTTPLSFAVDLKTLESSGDKEDTYMAKIISSIHELKSEIQQIKIDNEIESDLVRKTLSSTQRFSEQLVNRNVLSDSNYLNLRNEFPRNALAETEVFQGGTKGSTEHRIRRKKRTEFDESD